MLAIADSKLMKVKILLVLGAFALSMPALASQPLPRETIDAISAGLVQCTGGWTTLSEMQKRTGPAELAVRLSLLARPSTDLDSDAAEDLYQVAKGLLAPATGIPKWLPDGGASLQCPARPKEGVALLEYLVGEGPDDWRGYTNAFGLLGLAYESGASSNPDVEKARRYYLRWRIHSAIAAKSRWSDGVDQDVIANVERAGMRPYFDTLTKSERSGADARLLLAEQVLPNDPVKARALLRSLSYASISRLIELETTGRLPIIADRDDIAFWAKAWRTMMDYDRWSARMMKGVLLANGGSILTASRRPAIEMLRPYLDTERVAFADETTDPIAARALVDASGHAIYVEACSATPGNFDLSIHNRLNVGRLYNVARLPALPVVKIGGRPAYGWVILPAVRFLRPGQGSTEFSFTDLPASRCLYPFGPLPSPPPMSAPRRAE